MRNDEKSAKRRDCIYKHPYLEFSLPLFRKRNYFPIAFVTMYNSVAQKNCPTPNRSRWIMARITSLALATAFLAALPTLAHAQTPPKTWVDKDTGHRVWRLSDEPNSGGFYFNVNAYTPDGKQMIYTAPDGIHVLDLDTRTARLLVPNPPHTELRHRRPFRELDRPQSARSRRRPQDQQRLLHTGGSSHSRQPRLQGRHQHRRLSASSSTFPRRSASSASTPTRPSPPEPTSKATPPARSTAPTCPPPPALQPQTTA